jgi:hypothetical protein
MYALISTTLFFRVQITVQDEGRDMWQVYLGLKEYAAALEACRDLAQRDRVYAAQVPGSLCTHLTSVVHCANCK